MPAGSSENKVLGQDRVQFTYKWKAAEAAEFLQTSPWNLAKFSVENCAPYSQHALQDCSCLTGETQ